MSSFPTIETLIATIDGELAYVGQHPAAVQQVMGRDLDELVEQSLAV
jgi:hypothetical protein